MFCETFAFNQFAFLVSFQFKIEVDYRHSCSGSLFDGGTLLALHLQQSQLHVHKQKPYVRTWVQVQLLLWKYGVLLFWLRSKCSIAVVVFPFGATSFRKFSNSFNIETKSKSGTSSSELTLNGKIAGVTFPVQVWRIACLGFWRAMAFDIGHEKCMAKLLFQCFFVEHVFSMEQLYFSHLLLWTDACHLSSKVFVCF